MKNKKTPHPIKDERSSFRGTTFVQLFHNKYRKAALDSSNAGITSGFPEGS
jgi:hypothetical protein